MKNQTFKTLIPLDILWGFLLENGEDHETYYLFSKILYKKFVFRELMPDFIALIQPYYYESKKHYITRKMDYNRFITILRQLCNANNIRYETKMIYNSSTYEILYYIYKEGQALVENIPVTELACDKKILPDSCVG